MMTTGRSIRLEMSVLDFERLAFQSLTALLAGTIPEITEVGEPLLIYLDV